MTNRMSEDSVDAHNVGSNTTSETDSEYEPSQEAESTMGNTITLATETPLIPEAGIMSEIQAAGSQAPRRLRPRVAENQGQDALAQTLAAVLGGLLPQANVPGPSTKKRNPIFDLQK